MTRAQAQVEVLVEIDVGQGRCGVPAAAAALALARQAQALPGVVFGGLQAYHGRSEEHTSELQSLMRSSYAVFCLKKKNNRDFITLMNLLFQSFIIKILTSQL